MKKITIKDKASFAMYFTQLCKSCADLDNADREHSKRYIRQNIIRDVRSLLFELGIEYLDNIGSVGDRYTNHCDEITISFSVQCDINQYYIIIRNYNGEFYATLQALKIGCVSLVKPLNLPLDFFSIKD